MELAEALDPEEWHGILDRFFAIADEAVHRFEGTVKQYTGDGAPPNKALQLAPHRSAQPTAATSGAAARMRSAEARPRRRADSCPFGGFHPSSDLRRGSDVDLTGGRGREGSPPRLVEASPVADVGERASITGARRRLAFKRSLVLGV